MRDTIPSLFLDRVASSREATALRLPTAEGWSRVTWGELEARVRALTAAFESLGLGPHQTLALITGTRREWLECALAAWCTGAAITSIYPGAAAADMEHALAISEASIVVAEDLGRVAEVVARGALPSLRRIVCLEPKSIDARGVIGFETLLERGRMLDALDPCAFEDSARRVRPDDLAAIVFTSGTTGTPKGAELAHSAFAYVTGALTELGSLGSDDVLLLWLPMAHSFGTLMSVLAIRAGFETALDGRVERLLSNLQSVRPTFTCAVPRIFEKAYAAIRARAERGPKRHLLAWAIAQTSKSRIADRIVLRKIRETFGGRLRFFISGGAPLSADIASFFDACGLPILEGYGLTEACAASFVNRPDARRIGTVGQALPGTEVKLGEGGEIWIKSPGVMRGYRNAPELTAEAITEDGWLCTGDAGELDAGGYLKITDRLKDLIKTSTGRQIAPQRIESRLKALCPVISQVVVHGDRRPFCSALITVDQETIDLQAIRQSLSKLNAELAAFEQIRRFAVLSTDLSVETGEVTASLKVRRRAVEERHRAVLEELYDDELRNHGKGTNDERGVRPWLVGAI